MSKREHPTSDEKTQVPQELKPVTTKKAKQSIPDCEAVLEPNSPSNCTGKSETIPKNENANVVHQNKEQMQIQHAYAMPVKRKLSKISTRSLTICMSL